MITKEIIESKGAISKPDFEKCYAPEWQLLSLVLQVLPNKPSFMYGFININAMRNTYSF